jgi:hypothetical protein
MAGHSLNRLHIGLWLADRKGVSLNREACVLAERGLRVGAARRSAGRPPFWWGGICRSCGVHLGGLGRETVLGAMTVALAATAAILGWLLYTAVELASHFFSRAKLL